MKRTKFTPEDVMTNVQRLMGSRNASRSLVGNYQRLRDIYVTAYELSMILESCATKKGPVFNSAVAKSMAEDATTYLAGLHALANETLVEMGGVPND